MQTEIDVFAGHMAELGELQRRQAQVAADAQATLGQLLAYARIPSTAEKVEEFRIAVLADGPGRPPAPIITEFRNGLARRVQDATGPDDVLTTINEENGRLNAILDRYPTIRNNWQKLDLDRLAYLRSQVAHLCQLANPPGVTNAETLAQWDTKAKTAVRAMRSAELKFRRARFGEPPPSERPTRCDRDPALTTTDPAGA